MKPKLLVVSYFFPPLGGVGPLRMLKFARYLAEHGWDVTVARPARPTYEVRDERQLGTNEPFRMVDVPIWEMPRIPTRPYSLRRLTVRFYGVILPDIRVGWALAGLPAVARLARESDVVLSSSPPFSAHLLACLAARRSGTPWVADFRDPYIDNWYETYPMPKVRRWVQRVVLHRAAGAVVAWRGIQGSLDGFHGEAAEVLTGFEPRGPLVGTREHRTFEIVHLGSVYSKRYEALAALLEGLRQAIRSGGPHGRQLTLKFVGNTGDMSRYLDSDEALRRAVQVIPFVSRAEAMSMLEKADAALLLSPSAEGTGDFVPGKLFDYMAARKPIVGVVGSGRTKEILHEIGGSATADYDDPSAICSAILAIARDPSPPSEEALKAYTISTHARALSSLLAKTAGLRDPMEKWGQNDIATSNRQDRP